MRTITMIIIHCSAVKPSQQSGVHEIKQWHRANGWKSCGYHYVVRRDGTVEVGRRLDEVGAHCMNHNRHSIGICYEGGLDESGKPADTRTEEQRLALSSLVKRLLRSFPQAIVVGHRDLDPRKECPCFEAAAEFKNGGIGGILNQVNIHVLH